MTCPRCGDLTRVTRTKPGSDAPGADVTRERLCVRCRVIWTSDERLRPVAASSQPETEKPPTAVVPAQAPAQVPAGVPVRDSHARARSDSPSFLISVPSQADPDQTRAESKGPAKFWTAYDWRRRFEAAWSASYNVMHPRGGGEAESRACADLGDQLEAMSPDARRAAQDRAPAMFAEFLGDRGRRLVGARHPFSWFVPAFAGLLVPAKEAAAPQESFAEREAREKRERADRMSRERAEAARVQRELDAQLKRAAE